MSSQDGDQRSARVKMPTEIGLAYQTETKLKKFKSILKNVLKKAEVILHDEDDADPERQIEVLQKWILDFTDLMETNVELQSLLDGEQQSKHDKDFGASLKKAHKMKILIDALLNDLAGEPAQEERDAAVSHQDNAAPESIHESHEDEDVTPEVEDEDRRAIVASRRSRAEDGTSKNGDDSRRARGAPQRSRASSRSSRTTEHESQTPRHHIEYRSMLPALEPEVFRGDVERFALWIKAFESFIEMRTSSASERLHFLSRYTEGEARNAIQGYLLLNNDEAYKRAKQKLISRYGNDHVTANTYRQKIRDWPQIKAGDGRSLLQLADFLESCEAASHSVPSLKILSDVNENNIVLQKLPRHIVERWLRKVDSRVAEDAEGSGHSYPSFTEFVSFLSKEARVTCQMATHQSKEPKGIQQSSKPRTRMEGSSRPRTAFSTSVNEARHTAGGTTRPPSTLRERDAKPSSGPKLRCGVCSAEHSIEACDQFKNMTISERHTAVKEKRLCRGCLRFGHMWRDCRRKQQCNACGRLHPTLMHDDALLPSQDRHHADQETPTAEDTTPKATAHQVKTEMERDVTCSHSMIVPVMVSSQQAPDRQKLTYALLDLQSDVCFVTDSLKQSLDAEGEQVDLELSTMAGRDIVQCEAVRGLVIQAPTEDSKRIKMPVAFTRSEIPASRQLIQRIETVRKWPHLQKVADQLHAYDDKIEIGLLIGINCPTGVRPQEVVTGAEEEPWAVKTELGWSVVGGVSEGEACAEAGCRYVSVGVSKTRLCHYSFRVHAQVITSAQLSKVFDTGFETEEPHRRMSQEDHQCS